MSTYAQNRSIYFSLGLDIRSAGLSVEEANEIITTMQTDPQFAYDFLIQKEGVIVKNEKNLPRSKAKVERVGRLFNEKKKMATKKENRGNSISMNELLNHIINNISKYTTAITIQNICDNFNSQNNKSINFGRMSATLTGLTNRGLLTRIGKGIYRPVDSLLDQAKNHIEDEGNEQVTPSILGRQYEIGQERMLVDDFIRRKNTTGEFVFSLSDLRVEYPNACSKKLSKAVQNMKQNNPNITKVEGKLGVYKVICPVDANALRQQNETRQVAVMKPKEETKEINFIVEEETKEINFIIDAIKLIRSIGLEKAQLLLVQADKIVREI